MGWLKELLRELLQTDSTEKEKEEEQDRYVPGGVDKFFSKDLKQPSRFIRHAFGDHRDD